VGRDRRKEEGGKRKEERGRRKEEGGKRKGIDESPIGTRGPSSNKIILFF
jgi:hypothetical protein